MLNKYWHAHVSKKCMQQAAACWVAGLPTRSRPLPALTVHCPAHCSSAAAVRLIGTVGGKRELRVFERSKLLPFAIGIKPDRRKPEEIEWWGGRAALHG